MNEIGSAKEKNGHYLDFLPEAGTGVTIDGAPREAHPGRIFYRAAQDWLGEKPVDAGLKKAMLGQEANVHRPTSP